MSSRVLGSGGYGTVALDPTDPTKCIKTLTRPYPKQSEIMTRQGVLDTIDPPDPKNNKRKYFGGKITDKTVDPISKLITQFKMVLQGESLEKVHKTPATRDKLKKAFLNLLDGLCVLHEHTYSHNDIKKENITYDETTGALKFIDPDLFLTEFKTTSPSFFYHAYAPELWPSSRYNSSNIMEFNKNMETGGFFDIRDANNFEVLMRSTDLSSVNLRKPIHWWIQDLLKFIRDKSYDNHDYSKTDVYSLGLVAAHLFYKHYPELKPIIDCMIRPDPSNRCTAEEARDMWKRALKPSTKTVSFGSNIVHEPASVGPVIMQKPHTPPSSAAGDINQPPRPGEPVLVQKPHIPPSAAGDIKQPPRGASPRQNPAAVQLLYLAAVSFI